MRLSCYLETPEESGCRSWPCWSHSFNGDFHWAAEVPLSSGALCAFPLTVRESMSHWTFLSFVLNQFPIWFSGVLSCWLSFYVQGHSEPFPLLNFYQFEKLSSVLAPPSLFFLWASLPPMHLKTRFIYKKHLLVELLTYKSESFSTFILHCTCAKPLTSYLCLNSRFTYPTTQLIALLECPTGTSKFAASSGLPVLPSSALFSSKI